MNEKSIFILSLILFCISSLVYAQNSETRKLSSFNEITVGEAIDVFLIPGSEESVRIQVSGIDLDEVLTEVRGDELKIHLERGNHRNIDVEVWVTYKQLESVEISSAASVVTNGALKAGTLSIEASSAGDGELEVEVNELRIEVSSSADLKVSGRAVNQEISVSSAGKYDSYDLQCDEVEVSASSAGSARVNVIKKIDAHASSAGNIHYRGNPDKVYEDENSGGSIKASN